MPTKTIAARIKQLCCLGLGGQIIMPRLLKELRKLVPGHETMFFWLDDEYKTSNICFESPIHAEIAPLYFTEFHYKRDAEVYPNFSEIEKLQPGVENWERWLKVDKWRFYRHDFYNLLHRQADMYHILSAVVREHGKAVGWLTISRAKNDPEFSDDDKATLTSVLPYLAHSLTPADDLQHLSWATDDEPRIIVLNPRGELEYASPQARKLLFLATHPQISPATCDPKFGNPPVAVKLLYLYKNLRQVFEGERHVLPPVQKHQNAWGKFILRAYWLHSFNPMGPPYVGVTITHQAPLPIKLTLHPEKLPVPRTDVMLCLLLAGQEPYAVIAQKLGMSEIAVVHRSKRLYETLGAQNRKEFVEKLRGTLEHPESTLQRPLF
ncbi:MAG: hypothetical protein AB1469_03780 [Pseudomonadota bacterium]